LQQLQGGNTKSNNTNQDRKTASTKWTFRMQWNSKSSKYYYAKWSCWLYGKAL
jgi:hypothetical protein